MTHSTVYASRIRIAPHRTAETLVPNVPVDTALTLTGRSGEWFQVSYADQVGWIFRENVRVLGPIPNLPVVSG